MSHLGLTVQTVSEEKIAATVCLDERHVQSMGLLHGGISCVIAETLGSVLSNLLAAQVNCVSLGLEINANHIKSAAIGETVTGKCKFIHAGRSSHVLQIDIYNEREELLCLSKLTTFLRNID